MNKCKICNTEFEGEKCPNCGHSVLNKNQQENENRKAKKYSLISLVLTLISVIGIVIAWIENDINIIVTLGITLGLICSIISLIFSIISMIKGKDMAISKVAFILSIIWTIILSLITLFIITLFASCGAAINCSIEWLPKFLEPLQQCYENH